MAAIDRSDEQIVITPETEGDLSAQLEQRIDIPEDFKKLHRSLQEVPDEPGNPFRAAASVVEEAILNHRVWMDDFKQDVQRTFKGKPAEERFRRGNTLAWETPWDQKSEGERVSLLGQQIQEEAAEGMRGLFYGLVQQARREAGLAYPKGTGTTAFRVPQEVKAKYIYAEQQTGRPEIDNSVVTLRQYKKTVTDEVIPLLDKVVKSFGISGVNRLPVGGNPSEASVGTGITLRRLKGEGQTAQRSASEWTLVIGSPKSSAENVVLIGVGGR